MTDLKTGKSKSVRADVLREGKGLPDDLELTEEWQACHGNSDMKAFFDLHECNACRLIGPPNDPSSQQVFADGVFTNHDSEGFIVLRGKDISGNVKKCGKR